MGQAGSMNCSHHHALGDCCRTWWQVPQPCTSCVATSCTLLPAVCRPELQECVLKMPLSELADYCHGDLACAAFV